MEILFPFLNLDAFESVSNVCLLRNTASSFSHPGGAGLAPSSLHEVMSSGVTGFSVLPLWKQNLTIGETTHRQEKRKYLVRK